ncbi:cysteine dioxygenase type 1 isoform X2 [Oncorhynchus tshawytscha]|uniref:cysteine dioxygenase type 1 isoform X2 n=1 Tax=Oncorhynchus tshawytscha TaxID=74940 RepID=UPI000D0A2B64|nr:cysteine dioxygenase type 1 isoform X2 [Oncorhynchus tshawytscha]
MEKTEVMTPKSLDDLIKLLHKLFESDKINVEEVQQIMEAYDSNPQEWKKFAMFDPTSSIHDHTDSHCFMKMLQGELKETLFEWPKNKTQDVGDMVQKSQRILKENQCAYINDSLGLHRVENDSHTEGSVSLHLYSPPFDTCQTFDERTGHKNTVKMTFWSKFGKRTQSETTVSQENN